MRKHQNKINTPPRLIRRLEKSFSDYMRDALFRRLTFSINIYTKEEAILLSNNGLFNCMPKTGTRLIYKVACAFCSFKYTSGDYTFCEEDDEHYGGGKNKEERWFDAFQCKLMHMKYHSFCPLVDPDDVKSKNVAFADVFEELNIIPIKKRVVTFFNNKLCLNNLYQCDIVDNIEFYHWSLQCVICTTIKRNILTGGCFHVVMCFQCFQSLRAQENPHLKCPMCRKDIEFISQVKLPNVPFIIDF